MIIYFVIIMTYQSTGEANYKKAADWQYSNKGVIGLTTKVSSVYKSYDEEYRLKKGDIDILILGSSTLMGVTSEMFTGYAVYNGAKNANSLLNTISEGNYFIDKYHSIKYIVIGFDWILGKPYLAYKKKKYELIFKEDKIELWRKIKDAVSYQRIKVVISNLMSMKKVYRCPKEDNIGTDEFFGADIPGICNGFRYDGSATFAGKTPLTQSKYENCLFNRIFKYTSVRRTHGVIDNRYLNDLKQLDAILKTRGGKLIIYIPPLIPKAARVIEKSKSGQYLKKTMDTLNDFSSENNIILIDAAKSEDFGCVYSDFMDIYHAFPSCQKKILNTVKF
ncbi:hypothetical protein KKA17_10545 [bacterium]|nr:hypothetical protein [bacterium]MBU1884649.1 hypothetical protein [bacterium]